MTLNRFEQICKDYGLRVINDYPYYASAYFNNELVALCYKDKGQIFCYNRPFAFSCANKTMMIDNGECTEVHSYTELEENIVKTIGELKKLLIKIKKFEIDKEFE